MEVISKVTGFRKNFVLYENDKGVVSRVSQVLVYFKLGH